MPIRQFLNDENFDPETTRVTGVAFEMARVALQLRNRSDPADAARVAEKIITLAKTGERCPTVLCERALDQLGYPHSAPHRPDLSAHPAK